MMLEDSELELMAHVIQTAVAPVFLLAAISALLNVLANRLGRITDRARVLGRWSYKITDKDSSYLIETELNTLLFRSRLINFSITASTGSALLVCLVIITLFLGNLVEFDFSETVAVEFIICMMLLTVSLLLFLAEIFISTQTMKVGIQSIEALIDKASE